MTAEAEQPRPAVFQWRDPSSSASATPLVFASPHSGRFLPPDAGFDPALSLADLRSVEDAWIDRLLEPAQALGIPTLLAGYGRAYVDLNRDPGDLDPALVADLPPERAGGRRASAGYGVLHRLNGHGHPLYRHPLALSAAERRIASVHRPYHDSLAERLAWTHRHHGLAVLIDWHSMPTPRGESGTTGTGWPHIVLGDRHGASCAGALTRQLATLWQAEGLKVARNHPYAGGWTTQNLGRPENGIHAVQIEIDRSLYLDETGLEPGHGWARCQAMVERISIALVQALRQGLLSA